MQWNQNGTRILSASDDQKLVKHIIELLTISVSNVDSLFYIGDN